MQAKLMAGTQAQLFTCPVGATGFAEDPAGAFGDLVATDDYGVGPDGSYGGGLQICQAPGQCGGRLARDCGFVNGRHYDVKPRQQAAEQFAAVCRTGAQNDG